MKWSVHSEMGKFTMEAASKHSYLHLFENNLSPIISKYISLSAI